MRKLRTTVRVMHITAHPDDEHGGVLTRLSRGDGARVTLLTLNRGESGDNAIGPQLFDALGLIRTEELLVSNRYYGVDQQYFTTVVDYGFSKLLEEALGKWGRETVLRDVVRIVRMERRRSSSRSRVAAATVTAIIAAGSWRRTRSWPPAIRLDIRADS